MQKKIVFLNNTKNQQIGFKRTRGFGKKEEELELQVESTIKQFQVERIRHNYSLFNESFNNRYKKRTILFPQYIDLIEIRFFTTFNLDLKKKFYSKYGLFPLNYFDYNRSVTFEIIDNNLFDVFKSDIENIIAFVNVDVPYSGEDFNLISLIYEYKFIDSRLDNIDSNEILISMIQSSNNDTAYYQFNKLISILQLKKLKFSINDSNNLIYIEQCTDDVIETIDNNFDIVKSITSSHSTKVRPGFFGNIHTEYGFDVEIPNNLPIIGIIDTGVKQLDPFKDLLIEDVINITSQNNNDNNGHGTLVAGLVAFGSVLPSEIKSTYQAKCKILSIKALNNGNDGINFPLLIDAIKNANEKYGVRIFNMSLVFDLHKKYNQTFSEYAFELDKLSFELDILIFISVGNFNSDNLKELLGKDYHNDHKYPDFFYNRNGSSNVHSCELTNICIPSDSLNNISVGALAGNLENYDNSDITPASNYPAYYTRKFNFDYQIKINSQKLSKSQKNKYLNKPDFVFDGGDLFKKESGIEILSKNLGDFYDRTCGTSLSTPLITSIAAEILTLYPELHTQSIKALLLSSAEFDDYKKIPLFEDKKELLKKLVGFGVPNREKALFSDNNSIKMVVEDKIKPLEVLTIPIYLPQYLIESGNKLIFNISLAYSFLPDNGNHLNYLPLHISFNLIKNVDISALKENSNLYTIKQGINWSEDHFGKENILFSNFQKKQYKLQSNDLINIDGEVAIAIRCLIKDNIDETLKNFLIQNDHQFSIVIEIKEEIKNNTQNSLYDEIISLNRISLIGDIDSESIIDLDI